MSLKQPVQYPVKYYSHLDAGAPQLADADGVIKTILKACLVTGYGNGADAKVGAGWEMLFDDANRLIVRPPDAALHGFPDIKIENGIIDGTASHRIVTQDNPTGLDDAAELAAVNLLARDRNAGVMWHCIVTDLSFLLCYEMGEGGTGSAPKRAIMYCGALQNAIDRNSVTFVATDQDKIFRNGMGGSYLFRMLDDSFAFKDMINNTRSKVKTFLTSEVDEVGTLDAAFIHSPVFINDLILPFYFALTKHTADYGTRVVIIDDRPMLRFVDCAYYWATAKARTAYIPLDYWEF